MIETILIDDHRLVRAGFRQLLETDPKIKVVSEASKGVEGIKLAQELKPDVVILDIQLPDISGLEVTNRLLAQNSTSKILIVSTLDNDVFAFRALEAGVHGYLTKQASPEELIQAVKTVYQNQRFISAEIAHKLALAQTSSNSQSSFSQLSDRETEVMLMVVHHVPVKEMAKKLNLSAKTIHSYRSRIFEKLQVKNDTALILLAIKEGIVTIEEL